MWLWLWLSSQGGPEAGLPLKHCHSNPNTNSNSNTNPPTLTQTQGGPEAGLPARRLEVEAKDALECAEWVELIERCRSVEWRQQQDRGPQGGAREVSDV